jgi:hypothetical protein
VTAVVDFHFQNTIRPQAQITVDGQRPDGVAWANDAVVGDLCRFQDTVARQDTSRPDDHIPGLDQAAVADRNRPIPRGIVYG